MNGWFDVNKSKADEYFFVLKSGNGEVVMTSEMYSSRTNADNGIMSVQTNSAEDFNYERATAADGRFHFNLHAPSNHQVIGSSQMYATMETRETGIEAVKANGKSTVIKDNTRN